MSTMSIVIRPYRPGDLAALHEICIVTGYRGQDARGHYEDPAILPAVYAEPYAAFDPELVFVADDGGEVVGYVVGTADTAAHVEAMRTRWLPNLAARFPAPPDPPRNLDETIRAVLHDPDRMLVPEIVDDYPAHLHIDLLPRAQRRGLGRRLMSTFLDALRRRGVPGVHLGMDPANTGARAFYDRIGFTELGLPVTDDRPLLLGYRLV